MVVTINSIGGAVTGINIPRTDVSIQYVEDENNMHKYDIHVNTKYGSFSTNFYTRMGWNHEPTIDNVLSSLVLDATSYANNAVDDELQSIDNFADEFGYDKVSDALRAYKGCKKTYNDLCKVWNCNMDMLFDIADKYSEMGF